MTWSYSGDPMSDEMDAVRFLVGDTDSGDPLMQDEEIEHLLDRFITPYQAAVQACRVLAAKFAREVSHSGDGLSYSGSDLHKHYMALAEELDKLARRQARAGAGPYVGGISWKERRKDDEDADLIPTHFRSHHHDHPDTVQDRVHDEMRPRQ